ncbi:hypothetical protein [Streptomyces sp. ME19-01-6]|uniref:hypothetical protein n=1 Tax=Streptomyces sp. ME19-01-6 TaxID=3028686 RepID=UPI0029B33CA5|nr:hypothetical protein [Streptomyces sp. ME19-01-6]MDX3226913.1 hypothetical protein [Streptomyces sp. ME19-01-6]
MRPALRTLRTLPAVLVMAGVGLLAAPAVARGDDNDELAGTRAGEGRAHPGRTEKPGAVPPAGSVGPAPSRRAREDTGQRREGQRREGQRKGGQRTQTQRPQDSYGDAYDSTDSADPADSAQTDAVPTGRALRVLPLGTGLALMGLGLGLAFLGLRLRRP